jgi:hypothetical protein
MEFLRHIRQIRPRATRATRAAMTAPAVTRIAVAALVVVAVRLGGLRVLLRLRAGDEGRQLAGIGGSGSRLRRLLLWRRAIRLVLLRLMLRAALIMIRIRLLATVRLWLFARRIRRLLVVGVVLRTVEILRLLVAEIRLTLCRLILPRLTAVVVFAFEGFVTNLARSRRRLVVGILRPELFLRGGDHAQIVLGVLEVVLRGNRIA